MSEFPQPIEYDALPRAVMDYCTLAVTGNFADSVLRGSRVNKVVGLKDGSIVIAFDPPGRTAKSRCGDFGKWLFSADAQLYRVHPYPDELTRDVKQPHLVEVASHHIEGARVENVDVARFERVMTFYLKRREFTGEETGYRFIAELMGKHSNLILVDSSGIILASFKSVHPYQSRVREVRAGKEYKPPPSQDRIEPRLFTADEWRDFINSAGIGISIDEHIARTFRGMSPQWARTICSLAGVPTDKAPSNLGDDENEKLRMKLGETVDLAVNGIPLTGESAEDFTRRVVSEFSELAEDFAIDRARSELMRIINRRRKKLTSLAEGLACDLLDADEAEKCKKDADLILANIHRILPGMDKLEVTDWETGEKVTLPIEPRLTPPLQVERLYNQYRRLKRTNAVASERKEVVHAEEEELKALEIILTAAASFDEINEVREKAILYGLIEPPKSANANKPTQKKTGRPGELVTTLTYRYRSNDGFLILAGRNDASNDALRRSAHPEDIWLHTREIPGSHVYIVSRGKDVPETTIREAAMVAAWHSKARDGSNVPVDYTKAKYVTPIPGARAGKVNFRRERTIKVTPDEKRVAMMSLLAGGEPDTERKISQ